jgi:hypothetical protein
MARLLKHIDKVLLAICVVAFLASAALAPRSFHQLDTIAATNPAVGITPAKYEPQPAQVPPFGTIVWDNPQPQSRGREWYYDVFTPPVIYYNKQTAEFTVTPPTVSEVAQTNVDEPFDVDLLKVRQEPYRIQLRGSVGGKGTYLATFMLEDTGETVVGPEGRVFEAAGFTLRSLDVRKVTTNPRNSMPVVETVTFATILDNRTGREVTLNDHEPLMLSRFQAVLRLRTNPPENRIVREGSSVEVNGHSYLVIQLSINPQQAVISRRASDSLGAAETRTLTPIAEGGQATADTRPIGARAFPSL